LKLLRDCNNTVCRIAVRRAGVMDG